ncbi:MAG: hypothetical protein D0433_08460 [Candidatus Thermochlorobacter aerophilum]|uniref:Cyclic nucleotide-binding domain-containing protein n=1 Tax=Candidatus Thermochlorobacter aerophilus TaxID=1868324 RepID=A0A395LZH8_9BACT|nr:MAG: hypothetical protein D0433_08460 [Candidatus Thermochlorobacter aerophilum]
MFAKTSSGREGVNEVVGSLLGHLAFALIALSYLVRDIFWLRSISILSSLAGIIYGYSALSEPLWINIIWNMVFIAVNIVWIAVILKERRSVDFTDEEKELYSTVFHTFSPVEFMKLMRIGKWKVCQPNEVLIVEHQPTDDMMLIYNGEVEVWVRDRKIATLKDGAFVGEMSFLTGNLPTATVKATKETRCVVWSKEELRKLLNRNPSMWATLQGVLSTDLTKKLVVKNETIN